MREFRNRGKTVAYGAGPRGGKCHLCVDREHVPAWEGKRRVTEVQRSMEQATAVDPCTTACSPESMIFPGALAVTSIGKWTMDARDSSSWREKSGSLSIWASVIWVCEMVREEERGKGTASDVKSLRAQHFLFSYGGRKQNCIQFFSIKKFEFSLFVGCSWPPGLDGPAIPFHVEAES